MGVEIPLSRNSPWEHHRVVGLSNGAIKNELYARYGIAMLSSPSLKKGVAQAETNYDRIHRNELVVSQFVNELPYPLKVVQAKGEGINCYHHNGEDIVVTDSTNGIILPDGTRLWLNKPTTEKEIEKLLVFYGQVAQVPNQFISATGIAVVRKGKPPEYYFAQANLGAIGKNIAANYAELVKACSNASGGISAKEFLGREVIQFSPFVHFQLSRVYLSQNWTNQDLVGGFIMPRETVIAQLSVAPENYASFVAMSLGIIK